MRQGADQAGRGSVAPEGAFSSSGLSRLTTRGATTINEAVDNLSVASGVALSNGCATVSPFQPATDLLVTISRAFATYIPLFLAAFASPAHAADDAALAKDVLKRSVAIKTVAGAGQVPVLAAYYASVLKDAGFADADIKVTPIGESATFAATLTGTDPKLKPILLLGHMDVVAADPKDWTRDPFVPVEENGFIYGRGAEDNKYDVAMLVTTVARLKREGWKPRRTVILLLSGDEETAMTTSKALAKEYAPTAELALNGDAGGGMIAPDGKPMLYDIQAGEKTYADFALTFTDPGGHSSTPTATNPIYRLTRALDRLAAYQFAPMSSELTRASLKAKAAREEGQLAQALKRYADNPGDAEAAAIISAQPSYVGQVRTTCVATMASAGHAPNALPQRASANINCRIFPGVTIEAVHKELLGVIADQSGKLEVLDGPVASDASPLRKDVIEAVTAAVHKRVPGLEIAPSMSAGATDSLYFRTLGLSSYGVSSLFMKAADSFAHGLDERVPVEGIGASVDQWTDIIKALAR